MKNKLLKNFISLFLVFGLGIGSALSQEIKTAKPKKIAQTKAKVVSWGVNKQVNVQLFSGEKIGGRIADIKDDKLIIQLAENGQIISRDVPYENIKKISDVVGAGKIAGFTALGILAGIGGTLAAIMIAIYANEH
jgi:hypothetical protein